MNDMTLITTARLNLRLMEPKDSAFIIELLNEPGFIDNIGDKQVRTHQDAIHYMQTGPLECYKNHSFCLLLVCLKTGEPIGMCGLLKRDTLPAPDLGYAFLAKYYRQGYAEESCRAVLQHFNDIKPLYAITSQNNIPSQQLLCKLGFELDSLSNGVHTNEEIKQFIKY